MFAVMEGVFWLIRQWEERRVNDAFLHGVAYGS